MKSIEKIILVLIVLAILSLSACDYRKRQLMENEYPFYSEHIKQAIKEHRLIIGMTEDQVYLALGPTFCVSTGNYNGMRVKVLGYTWNPLNALSSGTPIMGTTNWLDAKYRVFLRDGSVVGWENFPF